MATLWTISRPFLDTLFHQSLLRQGTPVTSVRKQGAGNGLARMFGSVMSIIDVDYGRLWTNYTLSITYAIIHA